MAHVLIVDNYDSFTYNLAHYFESLGAKVDVFRNDVVPTILLEHCTHLVLSPGPGLPSTAGKMPAIIEKYWQQKPILGVCLGLQALAEFFGGTLYNQPQVMHGRQVAAKHFGNHPQFAGIANSFLVGLYHSWAVDAASLPPAIVPTAISAQGVLMAFVHEKLPIWAVQFHPESVLTPQGKKMLENFLQL
jgi:anthranilate synthase component II